jgi:D-amino-acid dehydrogenase
MTTIVLGAGAVGTATAWYLSKSGHDVVLVERQAEAAMETSWGNGGIIHASEVEPWSQPGMPTKIIKWLGKENAPMLLRYSAIPHIMRWGIEFARNCTPERFRENAKSNLRLALHSLKSLQEIGAETGIDYDRATRGVLKIYRSRESLDAAERSTAYLAQHGLLYERVDPERCVELEPALKDTKSTLAGALYFARDEVGDSNKFAQGLAAACAARGVQCRFGETIQTIETSNGRVQAVVTDKGRITADTVVVALGSFTAPMLAKNGIRVPIYPVKGVSITFKRAGWNAAPTVPVIDDSKLFGLRADRGSPADFRLCRDHRLRRDPGRCTSRGNHRQRKLHLPRVDAPFRYREVEGVGGPATGQPFRHAHYRRNPHPRSLDQRRPRTSRLDAFMRFRAPHRRSHRWSRSGHPRAAAAGRGRRQGRLTSTPGLYESDDTDDSDRQIDGGAPHLHHAAEPPSRRR